MALNALDRHLALIGFMGAGKTTIAPEVAERLGRRVVEADRMIEGRIQLKIGEFFASRGETEFRVVEAALLRELLDSGDPAVFDLGGGVLKTATAREALARGAFTVALAVDADTAWQRVVGTDRPLAGDEAAFRLLHDERAPLYREAADAVVESGDVDGVVLAAAGVHHEQGSLDRLGDLVPGDGAVALVGDDHVLGAPRRSRARRTRRPSRVDTRAAAGRVREATRRGRAAVARADARPRRHRRCARRRHHHRRRRLHRCDLPARRPVGRGPDDARRPGRCGDRRQDGCRHRGRQEPRRRLPLAGARRDRRDAARHAAGA